MNIKLYHGASEKYKTIKPMSADLGNLIQKPGWSTFCFKNIEEAEAWAAFKTILNAIRAKGYKGGDYVVWDPIECRCLVRKKLLTDIPGIFPLTGYVYTLNISALDVGFGHDNSHNEFTLRKEVVPDETDKYIYTKNNIKDYVLLCTDSELIKKREDIFSNNRGLVGLLMTNDPKTYEISMRSIKRAMRDGDLSIGDDLIEFLDKSNRLNETTKNQLELKGIYALANPQEDILKETMYYIDRMEYNTMQFARNMGIDYNDDLLLESYYIMDYGEFLNEGVISATWELLRNVAKKFAGTIVAIWKKLLDRIKRAIQILIKWFSGGNSSKKRSSEPTPDPIKVDLINLSSDGANIVSFTANTKDEVYQRIVRINSSLIQECERMNAQQIKLIEEQNRILARRERSSLSEATVIYGKEVHTSISRYSGTESGPDSLTHSDLESQRLHKNIESFNANKLKAVLDAKDIVKSYRDYIEFRIDQDIDSIDDVQESFINTMQELLNSGYTRNDIHKFMTERMYNLPDDPDVVRKLIHLRLNYNKRMVDLLNRMIMTNYNILGFTKEEMEKISMDLSTGDNSSIGKIKAALNANTHKFIRDNGIMDIRPLGAGVIFYTTAELGSVKDDATLGKLIQQSLQYDAIVVAHGDSGPDLPDAEIQKIHDNRMLFTETRKEYKEIQTQIGELINEIKEDEALIRKHIRYIEDLEDEIRYPGTTQEDIIQYREKIKDRKDRIEKLRTRTEPIQQKIKDLRSSELTIKNKLDDLSDREQSMERMARHSTDNMVWHIQPVHSLSKGPFLKMDDLVRQLIKEGFRRILLIPCNPGHHVLAKDILNTKGILIRMSSNSTLAESITSSIIGEFVYNDPIELNDISVITEAIYTKSERDVLEDESFGIPTLRKFRLVDSGHVEDAKKHFRHCPDGYEHQLADRIFIKSIELEMNINPDKPWFKYVSVHNKKIHDHYFDDKGKAKGKYPTHLTRCKNCDDIIDGDECVCESKPIGESVDSIDWDKRFYPCFRPTENNETSSEFQKWYAGYFMGARDSSVDDKMIQDWNFNVRRWFNKIVVPKGMQYHRKEEYIPEEYKAEVEALTDLAWDWRLDPTEKIYSDMMRESIINQSKRFIREMDIMNESLEFLNEAVDNAKLRKSIENDIYKLIDEMDKTGENTKLYKQRFAELDDKRFFELIDRLFSDPDFNLNIQYKPMSGGTNYHHFVDIANKFGITIYDYMVKPYLTGKDDDDAPVTVEKIHFGVIKERRLHQTIRTKTGTSTSISIRNSETGQVIGEDKHSRVSDVDLYSLIGQSQMRAAVEFHNERADDIVAQQNMLNQIRETGEYSMDKNESSVLNKTSLLTMYYYMVCAYLKNNIVEDSGLVLPATLKSRDIVDKIE